jgi:hypothetical protein
MSYTKYPYSQKILEDELNKNKKELDFWNSLISDKNALIARQAKGNIGGCQSRIKDLTESINNLNTTSEI